MLRGGFRCSVQFDLDQKLAAWIHGRFPVDDPAVVVVVVVVFCSLLFRTVYSPNLSPDLIVAVVYLFERFGVQMIHA